MHSVMKKVLGSVLAAALIVSTPVHAAVGSPTTGNQTITAPDQTADRVDVIPYTSIVDTNEDGTAAFSSIEKTTEKSVKVPSKVTVNGVEYTVVEIKAKAFTNATKATKITIPDSVKVIDKKAFSKAAKLKTIKFNNTKNIKVKKGAFKGLDTTKMTIKVTKKMSKKQFKKFKKTLEKAGFKGKIKKLS
ncbi:leucine-rich repeat protein [Butyrivibrio sp. JL13D10]|uniref:leucine-rich repeat protein n=1 Tax=Butyrivibrio sp. JL13D10 TaxID=3236815 RepID=UPI0038B5AF0C